MIDTETAARLRTGIGRLHRRLRRTPSGAAAGLTPTGISVLFTAVREGPIRLSQLAAVEGINPTMLSRVVSELGAAGLLERLTDPGDRRAAFVDATPAGRELVEQIRGERTDVLNRALLQLSGEQRAQLEAALPALDRLSELLKDRRP
jgi:DNA-binding MarR family transcriptional regulator